MEEQKQQPQTDVETPVIPKEPEQKPKKRVLTEAQRLAFLKGREKRMLSIQKKKEEKQEAERLAKEEEEKEIKPASTEPLPEVKQPLLKPKEEVHDDDDEKAKKIADYVYLKLMKDVEALPPETPVKPKRAYRRRTKSAPILSTEDPEPTVKPASLLPPEKIISWC